MFVLECKVEVGKLVFTEVVDVSITKSVDVLSDVATVKLPTHFVLNDERKQTENEIKTGDRIRITLGYRGVYSGIEFDGYVTKVKPQVPVVVECEDLIYKVRQKSFSKLFKKTSLKEIISHIASESGFTLADDIPEVEINKFLLKKVNGAQSLEKLKKEYNLTIYINDENQLYAGLKQLGTKATQVTYDLNKNIVKNALEFKKKEDVKIQVHAKSFLKNNKVIEAKAGDEGGEKRTHLAKGITSESKLKEVAESKIEDYKYDGFRGALTSFLVPVARRGMSAKIIDVKHQGRDGVYFITKVVVKFGQSGARRVVTLGKKLSI